MGAVHDLPLGNGTGVYGSAFNTVLRSAVELQQELASLGPDRQAVMDRVVQRTRELTGATAAHVVVLEDSELISRAWSCPDDITIPGRHPAKDNLCGIAVQTGRSVLCIDTEKDEKADALAARRIGIRSLVAVPLLQA